MKIFVGLLLLIALPALGQTVAVTIGHEFAIQSRVMGEERRYFVNLPSSYEHDDFYVRKRYPVLILLDGDTHFHPASGIVRSLSAEGTEQIPELIVVAVRNTQRTRDLTPPGDDAFWRFLEDELLPRLDSSYRTLPYRVLVGHSLGGLFAVQAFLDQSRFDAYLAIDPSLAWNNQAVVETAKRILNTQPPRAAALYLSQANNPFQPGKDAGSRGAAFQSFVSAVEADKSTRFGYRFFEQEDHFSVPTLSLYHGLLFLFEGYKFPLHTLAQKTASDVRLHYARFAERLGVPILPPGKLLNQVGLYQLHNEKNPDKAIELLQLNEAYYPDSFVTFNSLGEAYRVAGNPEAARRAYRKALALRADNPIAQRALAELTQPKP